MALPRGVEEVGNSAATCVLMVQFEGVSTSRRKSSSVGCSFGTLTVGGPRNTAFSTLARAFVASTPTPMSSPRSSFMVLSGRENEPWASRLTSSELHSCETKIGIQGRFRGPIVTSTLVNEVRTEAARDDGSVTACSSGWNYRGTTNSQTRQVPNHTGGQSLCLDFLEKLPLARHPNKNALTPSGTPSYQQILNRGNETSETAHNDWLRATVHC